MNIINKIEIILPTEDLQMSLGRVSKSAQDAGIEFEKFGQALSPCLCKWWLRTRPCKLATQLNNDGVPPCIEFYVPWWGWPFEIFHRLIFGSTKIK